MTKTMTSATHTQSETKSTTKKNKKKTSPPTHPCKREESKECTVGLPCLVGSGRLVRRKKSRNTFSNILQCSAVPEVFCETWRQARAPLLEPGLRLHLRLHHVPWKEHVDPIAPVPRCSSPVHSLRHRFRYVELLLEALEDVPSRLQALRRSVLAGRRLEQHRHHREVGLVL